MLCRWFDVVNESIMCTRIGKDFQPGPGFPVVGFKYQRHMISISSRDCYAVGSEPVLGVRTDLPRDFSSLSNYSD